MSKKNNQQTRAKEHAYKLAKEKAEAEKRAAKAAKKATRAAADAVAGQLAATGVGGSSSAPKLGIRVKKGIKIKARPVRLKKNKVVRGIKIVDAESRRRAKELLAAEEAMREMEMDSGGKEAAGAGGKKGGSKKTKKISFATGEGMDTD